jgi:hypothetical protein
VANGPADHPARNLSDREPRRSWFNPEGELAGRVHVEDFDQQEHSEEHREEAGQEPEAEAVGTRGCVDGHGLILRASGRM